MSEGPSWVERRTVSGKRVQTPGRWLTGLEEEEKRADGQKEGRRRKKREGKKKPWLVRLVSLLWGSNLQVCKIVEVLAL